MLGYRSFGEMKDHVADHTGNKSTSSKERIGKWINSAYQDIASSANWPTLLEGFETGFSVTANERFVFLPKDIAEVLVIMPSSREHVLTGRSILQLLRTTGVSFDVAGVIRDYAPAGEVGRKADIATAETMEITPGGSGENFSVTIHGVVGSDNDEVIETVSITNSAPTASVNTYSQVYSFSSDGSHAATFTITGSTSSTEYATISEDERTARYKRIRLWNIPSTAETLLIYYKKRVFPFVDDNQTPAIPVSEVLVHRALASEYSDQRKWGTAMQVHRAEADRILQALIETEMGHMDEMRQGAPIQNRTLRRRGGWPQIIVNN